MTETTRIHGLRNHPSLHELSPATTAVHIVGVPFFWLITYILEKSPQIKTISMTFKQEKLLRKASCRALEKRGIQLEIISLKENDAQPRGNTYSKRYLARRRFLETIDGEAGERLEKLLASGWKPAEILLKYYGVRGHSPQTQRSLMQEYDYQYETVLSRKVTATLHYLNPSFGIARGVQSIVRSIEKHVDHFFHPPLQKVDGTAKLKELLEKICQNRVPVPAKIPPRHEATLRLILSSQENGMLEQLKKDAPRKYQALLLRFGLFPSYPPIFRSLKKVGHILGHLCRERARQLINGALARLKGTRIPYTRIGAQWVAVDIETATLARTLGNAAARHWNLPGNVFTNQYRQTWARHTTLYLLHTFYGWSYEKIRETIGLNKATTVEKSCALITAKVTARPADSRPMPRSWWKFYTRFDALSAELALSKDTEKKAA